MREAFDPVRDVEHKQLCFTCTHKSHADFKVRLMYDGLTQGAFFRLLMHGYIQQDENIMNFIDTFKEKYKIQKLSQIKKSKRLVADGRKSAKDFALDPEELQSIFDLIAQEHPDL
tara:strand:- start:1642 stop:1986 length:345 start_codon:yes stop_codon:yes gene_type:complete